MSQHDMDILNAANATVRADLNLALKALASNSSGAAEPATPYTYQFWADTTADRLKIRNAANSDWISIMELSTGVMLGGQIAGLRNRIINGDMRIDVRNTGAAQTFTAAAAAAYCVDRFYGFCTGANVTGQRVAGSGVDQYLYQFTGATSVTGITFGQRIEATNVYDLANTTATFSVELANSLLTSVTWRAYYANAADDFSAKTQIATGTFTVNSALAKYSAQIALGASAGNGVCIELSVGAQTSGTWKIGSFQLDPGSVATGFERRPIGLEKLLCFRYSPFWSANTSTIEKGCMVNGATTMIIGLSYPVTPRVPPTGIATTGTFAALVASAGYVPTPNGSVNFYSASDAQLTLTLTGTSGLITGDVSFLVATGGLSTILATGCEL